MRNFIQKCPCFPAAAILYVYIYAVHIPKRRTHSIIIKITRYIVAIRRKMSSFFSLKVEPLDSGYCSGYKFTSPSFLSYKDAMIAIRRDPSSFITMLQSEQLPCAYFLEFPPVTSSTAARIPFEFVILPAPGLKNASADPEPFRDHFTSKEYAVFSSLGGDSVLIAPAPIENVDYHSYTHLGNYIINRIYKYIINRIYIKVSASNPLILYSQLHS